jgi:hypothetical protein
MASLKATSSWLPRSIYYLSDADPGTLALIGTGLVGLATMVRRQSGERKRATANHGFCEAVLAIALRVQSLPDNERLT